MKKNKKMTIEERSAYHKGVLRGIILAAVAVTAFCAAPTAKKYAGKALKHIDEAIENDGYYHDHVVMSHIQSNLDEYQGPHDEQYRDMEKTLERMKEHHEHDKKTTRCWACDDRGEKR